VLWRPLRDALPANAAVATESPRHDELAAEITRRLGGRAGKGPPLLAGVVYRTDRESAAWDSERMGYGARRMEQKTAQAKPAAHARKFFA
jgi:hypothetical protein